MAKVYYLGYLEAIARAIPIVPTWVLNDDANPVKIGLYTNDSIPDPSGPLTQFDAPTYAGYARQAFPPTDGAPFVYFDANTATWFIKLGTGFWFQPTSESGLPQTVYGYVVGKETSSYLFAEPFDEPFTFTTAADGLEVNPLMGFPLNLFQ